MQKEEFFVFGFLCRCRANKEMQSEIPTSSEIPEKKETEIHLKGESAAAAAAKCLFS
jgi:hypothetical protein